MKNPTFRDVELLSAYLDGKLSQADSARLVSRLKTDPELRSVLNDLSSSRSLLRKMPQRRAPRNFTLTPQMARVKPPLPRAVPALRWATSLATLLLFVTIAANALSPSLAAPAFGRGGGGGEAPMLESAPAAAAPEAPATEAPALDAAPAATEAPTLEASESYSMTTEALPTDTTAQKDMGTVQSPLMENAPLTAPEPAPASAPIPLAWQLGLLVVALCTGGLAYILVALADNSWRRNVK